MSAFSTIGIIFLVCAVILFAYQVMAAFLGMGTSDDFLYENNLQGFAYTVITMPLVLLLLCGALLFFLIHMFKGHKHK